MSYDNRIDKASQAFIKKIEYLYFRDEGNHLISCKRSK